VPFAREQFTKGQPALKRSIDRLIANLDSDDFDVREEASGDLAKLGWSAEPAMRKALTNASSAEVTNRLKRLLAQLPEEKFDPALVFASRVTEMLEHVGTPEARELLTELAKGPPKDRLVQEANASLKRLRER
jgi:HEAT repeat protein